MSYDFTEKFVRIITNNSSFIIKVKDFSNETIHKSGEPAALYNSIMEYRFLEKVSLVLFANGKNSDDKGYVTVEFRISKIIFEGFFKTFEFSCVFSVIDASENKRCPHSFQFPSPSDWSTEEGDFYPIIVDRLLKRDFLLSDKEDLLPGDCLSLHIDFEIRTMLDYGPYDEKLVEDGVKSSFEIKETVDGMEYSLYLDSELAKRLAEVSAYFQRMLETPMVERKTRRMKVAEEEYTSFKDICKILMGVREITFDSIEDICQMYITADKYDIPIAVGNCRELLTILLRTENDIAIAEDVRKEISTLLELSEKYNDVRLKENIESFLDSNRQDGEEDRSTQKILQSNLETEWKFERDRSKATYRLTFLRNNEERPEVNIYK